MIRNSARFFAFALLVAGACSGGDKTDADGDGVADGVVDPNNVTVVVPTKPQGYVAGEVRDAATDRPIEGVKVRLVGGGVEGEAETDATGAFRFGPINAGAALALNFSHAGHFDAQVNGVTIDDMAGNFPTVNGAAYVGPVGLLADDGKFAVQVVSEEGSPVMGAEVTIETGAGFFLAGTARATGVARANTDAEGLANVEGLPNVWSLPPRFEASAALVVNVAPVDSDGDMRPDWNGAALAISGRDARTLALPPVLVLRRAGTDPLAVLASNLPPLAGQAPAQPALLGGPDENIRVVFNKPIDRNSVLVDLRNEDGSDTILTAVVTSGLDNVLEIDPAEALLQGQEYNMALRVQSRDALPTEVLNLGAPFFVADERNQPIVIAGRFSDLNGDSLWGTADQVSFSINTPVGRPGAAPAFSAAVWLSLDLNGDAVIGNSAGELPSAGAAYPPPLMVDAAEPSPGNGAGLSGYTRNLAPIAINLLTPLSQASGAVAYELRINADLNGGRFVTTPSGRDAPAVFTASAPLVR